MQLMEGAPGGLMQVRAFGGTCPDCCGDLGVSPIEGGWVLACIHCGTTISDHQRLPAGRGAFHSPYATGNHGGD
jgi:hypothetical protein